MKRNKENKVLVDFANRLDRKIERLARKIANFSAYKDEEGVWWGMDTDLGDLPFKIRKELAKFADWIIQNAPNLQTYRELLQELEKRK